MIFKIYRINHVHPENPVNPVYDNSPALAPLACSCAPFCGRVVGHGAVVQWFRCRSCPLA
jgi:hypothetical protein